MEIDKQYIINLIGEIEEEYIKNNKDYKPLKLKYPTLYLRTPDFIKIPLYKIYKFLFLNKNKKPSHELNTLSPYNLRFIKYILESETISLDLNLFEVYDGKEIERYVKNNIYQLMNIPIELTSKEILFIREYKQFKKRVKKIGTVFKLNIGGEDFYLPTPEFENSVFYHGYGLSSLNKFYDLDLLKGKDFIDGGTYNGDSALIFKYINPKTIHCFEPDKINFKLLEETKELNGIINWECNRLGLGDKEEERTFNNQSTGSTVSEQGKEKAKIITIDSYSHKNKLDVGLIKLDIEGYEFKAIEGAEETIKKFKPVLILAIYHTGKDFFELPRLLKEYVPEYSFRFLNLDYSSPNLEKILVAYVK